MMRYWFLSELTNALSLFICYCIFKKYKVNYCELFMKFKLFWYAIFFSLIYLPVHSTNLSVILDSLQEELIHIARDRDLNDAHAQDALLNAVNHARTRVAQEGLLIQDFDNQLCEFLAKEITELAKKRVTRQDALKYSLYSVAASSVAFFLFSLLLNERKNFMQAKQVLEAEGFRVDIFHGSTCKICDIRYPRFWCPTIEAEECVGYIRRCWELPFVDPAQFFCTAAVLAGVGGVTGLGSFTWLKDAVLGNQDYIAHERLSWLQTNWLVS